MHEPRYVLCSAAYADGPTDPAFDAIDAAAGPGFEDAAGPVVEQASSAFAPVRTDLGQVCSAFYLASPTPDTLPPPMGRIDVGRELCYPD